MNQWTLPTSLIISGVEYDIRTDFRAILDILTCFQDPDLDAPEKWAVALQIAFPKLNDIPPEDIGEAQEELKRFIDLGAANPDTEEEEDKPVLVLMDWDQDAALIIPAINRVYGQDIRGLSYLHWWTFVSAYMEIGECTYSTILSIRQKMAKGKKLEKYEKDFLKENKRITVLRKHLSEEEQEQEAADRQALKDLIG